mmetsp:Transcript_20118/g.24800  ORF Transcript_20118/g.24800 Transcript_20118/m.24800 type:complete len:297 (-) Transcript_20118:103-993(-)
MNLTELGVFDTSNFVDEKACHDFICAICQSVCNKCIDVGCGHIYCKECLKQYCEHANYITKCPQCFKSFDIKDSFENKFAVKQLNKLKVKCPSHNFNLKCNWLGYYSDLTSHLHKCSNFEIVSANKYYNIYQNNKWCIEEKDFIYHLDSWETDNDGSDTMYSKAVFQYFISKQLPKRTINKLWILFNENNLLTLNSFIGMNHVAMCIIKKEYKIPNKCPKPLTTDAINILLANKNAGIGYKPIKKKMNPIKKTVIIKPESDGDLLSFMTDLNKHKINVKPIYDPIMDDTDLWDVFT